MEGLTARIERRGQKQVIVLSISAATAEGLKDEVELFGPSQEIAEAVAVTVLGFVEGRLLTVVDGNPVAFSGARSVFAHKLTTQFLAEALKDKTFQFCTERA